MTISITASNMHKETRIVVAKKMESVFSKILDARDNGKFKTEVTVLPLELINFKRELRARGFTVRTSSNTLFIEWWNVE